MSQITDPAGATSDLSDVANQQSSTVVHSSVEPDRSASRQRRKISHYGAVALSWIPSVLVVSGLIGLAWIGHHNDWKLPNLNGINKAASSEAEWCDAHGVPEAECINCVPGLIEDQPKLNFCQKHGVHGCLYENPSLAETKRPAEVLPSDLERAARAIAVRPRRENLALSRLPGSRIQFATIDSIRRAGIDVEPVERRDLIEGIKTAGEIRYNATRTAHVSPSVNGIVRKVFVNVGDSVDAGEVMALIDSEKVGRMKSELLSSLSQEQLYLQTVSRLRPLADSQAIAGKRLFEAEAALQQAAVAVDQSVRALRNLGLRIEDESLRTLNPQEADTLVRNLGLERMTNSLGIAIQELSENWIAVTSPLEGRVVERNSVVGEVVDRGSQLFRVSDTKSVWLDLRVPAEEARFASLNQIALYRPDGTDEVYEGQVSWISSDVDAKTRTVRVRAELTNEDGRLRNESFGTGEILLREESDAIVVPNNAIQWDGENCLVFVRDKRFFDEGRPKFFVARSVRTGVVEEGFTEIIAGVLPGEVVATSGSDVLRAQLLKSNLGAGCTCGH